MFQTSRWSTAFACLLVTLLSIALPTQLRVIDFHPNTSSDPSLVALGDDLYVAASTGQGRLLFRYNPTLPAPIAIVDQVGRLPIVSVQEPTVVGGLLFCKANAQGFGPTLWVVDPRAGDVARMLLPGGSDPLQLKAVGTQLFFSAEIPGNGRELCVSNGQAAGTGMVKNIHPTGPSDPTRLAAFGMRVVFRATDGNNGMEPWISDGTLAGTVMLRNIRASGSSDPTEFTTSGPYCYFAAGDGSGRELWRTDGSTTSMMTVRTGSGESDPTALADFGGTLYFTANGGIGQGFELWRLVAGATTASPVIDLRPGSASSQPDGTTAVGSLLYFSAVRTNEGRELFAYAPASAIAQQIWLSPGTGDGVRLDPLITALGSGNAIAFAGNNGATGFEPWTTSGVRAPLAANVSLTGSSDPDQFTVLGDELYFAATDQGTYGREVWAVPLSGLGSGIWLTLGAACARANGTYPALTLSSDPNLGTTTVLTTAGAVPFGPVVLAASTRPLQVVFGACTWRLDTAPGRFFVLPTVSADATGTARLPVPIPDDMSLLGQRLLFQAIVVEAGGPMLGVGALSNGVDAYLGN